MPYSIKAAAARCGLSEYTLRYYDKAGLLPFVARDASGYRAFTDGDMALLHTIICLKNTGMRIDDIRTYIQYVMAGTSTVAKRRALLQKHREAVAAKQRAIAENLKEIDYKLAMYEDPQAAQLVARELAAASQDKQAANLPDAFAGIH
ncbi:MerR family transcriptional regulator [Lacticaseibacillus yichunensis]|uniref:MerR family transcriptional regulator n=1 Tax=Lacticaseibacillus yichunensis TaxID=2486015 RepID=A0ABW4CRR5_9LACO|nr:MerR family transcriptional regulator [Lacticaseibacillus yichunensis]